MTPPLPSMLDLPGADVPIGTPFADLEHWSAEFKDLGVRPEWLQKESPRFHLRIEAFRIAERPISRSDYVIYLHAAGRRESASALSEEAARDDHPARLSHEEAVAYAAWISRETGRNFRLPTEYEWEYAAAGREARPWPWGRRYREGVANTAELGLGDTRPIGANPANVSWCGAIDMAGNVEEWTSSVYRPYPGGTAVRDGFNPEGQDYIVTRGGSYLQSRDCARCQRRHGIFGDAVVGLRLAEG